MDIENQNQMLIDISTLLDIEFKEVKIKLGIGFSFDLKSLVKLIEEVFNKCKDTQY